MLFGRINILIFILLVLFSFNSTYSQTFGFGCLGLFGGYGGVAYQKYNASGFNKYIDQFNSGIGSDGEKTLAKFEHSLGYRVGVNFFRAQWQGGFMITAKGYFQGLSKTNEATKIAAGERINYSFDLDIKHWALGIDIGFAITKAFSWKIAEGTINFNNFSLTETQNMPGETLVSEYESESGNIGYSVVTGIIINLIHNYVSIEGSAGYTYLKIDDLKTGNGVYFLKGSDYSQEIKDDFGNFIESGGFVAIIQLNIGFPL